jgi:Fe-S-cluster-containing dehydrogenase component
MDRRRFIRTGCAGTVGACGIGGGLVLAQSQHASETAGQPKPQKRLALTIDLAMCGSHMGCHHACIDACHAAHNVPSIEEPGREVKWIYKQRFDRTFPNEVHEVTSPTRRAQPVVVMCNHCANPACVRVCPTGATFRRADGIVMMDEHRCIGCRYCMTACPYGARSFNWKDPRDHIAKIDPSYPTRTVGVVEKCTLCADRIVKGLLPLCVEACTASGAGAMAFGDPSEANSPIARLIAERTVLRRRPELSTSPSVFYLI